MNEFLPGLRGRNLITRLINERCVTFSRSFRKILRSYLFTRNKEEEKCIKIDKVQV